MTDVARRAGVSIATVSRALSGAPRVSPATRERITALAHEMSYAISPSAARLARGASATVAVVTANVSHWFYATMLEGILGVLSGADVDVLVYEVKAERERSRFFHDLPARRQADALIIMAFPLSAAEQERLDLMGMTVVMAGGALGEHPHVRVDDVAAGRQATEHLVRAGHRRIAMVNAAGEWTLPYAAPRDRHRGFVQALDEAGIEMDEQLVVDVLWGSDGGSEGMGRLLSVRRPPTAVVAFSDEVAFGALRTLRRASVAVPASMSVVGIDDHATAGLMDLTTVHQPVAELGAEAARLSLAALDGREGPERFRTLDTHLVVRGSTGPPA